MCEAADLGFARLSIAPITDGPASSSVDILEFQPDPNGPHVDFAARVYAALSEVVTVVMSPAIPVSSPWYAMYPATAMAAMINTYSVMVWPA
jgi:hypothetical protein